MAAARIRIAPERPLTLRTDAPPRPRPGGAGDDLIPEPTFDAPTPHIVLPPNLGRPPTTDDLIITRTFDGLTPEEATRNIINGLRTTVFPPNRDLVDVTAAQRTRDLQTILNNLFSPTPVRDFFDQLGVAGVTVHMSMGGDATYEARVGPEVRFYRRDWSGRFEQVSSPGGLKVIEAAVRFEPQGLRVSYPSWEHPGLAGPVTEIFEPS